LLKGLVDMSVAQGKECEPSEYFHGYIIVYVSRNANLWYPNPAKEINK
jgi:hypothetical protein